MFYLFTLLITVSLLQLCLCCFFRLGIYVTIILYVKVDACDQTAGLDAQIEANVSSLYA